ncbi:MAG: hypothetical protein V4555_08265 [Acidobacteriota bacterium]
MESVSQEHFDAAAIERLCDDLRETGAALAELEGQLRELGIALT